MLNQTHLLTGAKVAVVTFGVLFSTARAQASEIDYSDLYAVQFHLKPMLEACSQSAQLDCIKVCGEAGYSLFSTEDPALRKEAVERCQAAHDRAFGEEKKQLPSTEPAQIEQAADTQATDTLTAGTQTASTQAADTAEPHPINYQSHTKPPERILSTERVDVFAYEGALSRSSCSLSTGMILVFKVAEDEPVLLDESYEHFFETTLEPIIRAHCPDYTMVILWNFVKGWRIDDLGQVYAVGHFPEGIPEAPLHTLWATRQENGAFIYQRRYFERSRNDLNNMLGAPSLTSIAAMRTWHASGGKTAEQLARIDSFKAWRAAQPKLPPLTLAPEAGITPENSWYLVTQQTIVKLEVVSSSHSELEFTGSLVHIREGDRFPPLHKLYRLGEETLKGSLNLETGASETSSLSKSSDSTIRHCPPFWISKRGRIQPTDHVYYFYRTTRQYVWEIDQDDKCLLYRVSKELCVIEQCSHMGDRPSQYLVQGEENARNLMEIF